MYISILPHAAAAHTTTTTTTTTVIYISVICFWQDAEESFVFTLISSVFDLLLELIFL
jgi:hypothetical protein